MVFDGSFLRDLIVQVPVTALLVIFIFLDRRDHKESIKQMREDNARLETALVDHMNRLNE